MAPDLRNQVAIIGAAETDSVGRIPEITQLGLHAQAARNAIRDAGIDKSQIDGLACAGESVVAVADYLDIQPSYVDGTSIGGSSFMIHVAHAVAALTAGYCQYVLITHGESGRSRVGRGGFGGGAAAGRQGQHRPRPRRPLRRRRHRDHDQPAVGVRPSPSARGPHPQPLSHLRSFEGIEEMGEGRSAFRV